MLINFNHEILKKIVTNIKLIILDVDGVLTNGKLLIDGKRNEIKNFNVKDGLGIKLLLKSNINIGIISSRSSKALSFRCDELGIKYLIAAVEDKAKAFEIILRKTNVSPKNTGFVADDLPDIPPMLRSGLPIAVADANKTIKNIAGIITSANGGYGAVREITEFILKTKGQWNKLTKYFFK